MILFSLLGLAIACEPVTLAAGTAPVDRLHAQVVAAFNDSDANALFALWSPVMAAAVPLAETEALVSGMLEARGCLVSTARTGTDATNGVYAITAERGAWKMQLTSSPDGEQVLGLSFGEPAAPPPDVADSKPVRLPFEGEWKVFWGGDSREDNHHVEHPSQRRAADLMIVDESGRSHSKDGTKNDHYYAYGKPILAVASGTVVSVVDGVADNVPGAMNPYFAPGNTVILEHDGEWSVYSHLIPGSIEVAVGDRVKIGAKLGHCGNSGNSSEPHLHFQMQNGPLFEDSWGLRPVFEGAKVTRGEETLEPDYYRFQRGDLVRGR